jgi:1-acyl-sn-glycerol-3-phosphate acyltransferase
MSRLLTTGCGPDDELERYEPEKRRDYARFYCSVNVLARQRLGASTRFGHRRIDLVGLENIPESGPLIVAANHQNALVDPMLLLGLLPRRLVSVAKATLFRHPLIGPLLRLVGALPVHRRQEGAPTPRGTGRCFPRRPPTSGRTKRC